jgi:O-antigen/teichoic acid export membrane protein
MLVHYGMAAANGVYTMAYRIVDFAMIPIGAVQSAAFPRFFQAAQDGVKGAEAFARRILRKTFPISAVLGLLLWVSAPAIPRFLGSGFADSVPALRVLCFLPLFRTMQYSAGDALTGSGHQKVRLAVQGSVALLNLSANLYLIPRFGWHGAAWSSLASDAMLGAMNWGVLRIIRTRRPEDCPILSPTAQIA